MGAVCVFSNGGWCFSFFLGCEPVMGMSDGARAVRLRYGWWLRAVPDSERWCLVLLSKRDCNLAGLFFFFFSFCSLQRGIYKEKGRETER